MKKKTTEYGRKDTPKPGRMQKKRIFEDKKSLTEKRRGLNLFLKLPAHRARLPGKEISF